MMQEYANKIAPVYSPVEPTDARSVLEYANSFRVGTPIVSRQLVVARYHGLPGAVMAHYEAKYARTGRQCIKKILQMMTVAPLTGPTGKKITQKIGVKGMIVDGIWYTMGRVKIQPVMAFNFGLVFANASEDEVMEAMRAATDWLPVPVGVEVKTI